MPRCVRIKGHWGGQRPFIVRTLFAGIAAMMLLLFVVGRLLVN